MSTVGDVIDRVQRDYLVPPGEQPARFVLNDTGGISDTDTSAVVDTTLLTAEEEDLVGAGTLLEIDSELILVEAVTGTSPNLTLTIRRGMLGTTTAAHADGTDILIAGDDYIPRFSIFEAVADAIESLWPELWTVGVEETFAAPFPVELPAESGEVLKVLAGSGSRWRFISGWDELQDFPLSETGNAVQLPGISNGSIQVYYKTKTVRPTVETDTLASLNVEDGWVKVVVLTAVASLIARTDLSKATAEFITQALEAEGFAPGEGADIRNALLQLEEFQIQPLKRQLAQQQHNRVHVDDQY